jgi:hypothetical protein
MCLLQMVSLSKAINLGATDGVAYGSDQRVNHDLIGPIVTGTVSLTSTV